jgi:hypothetical protein
MPAVQMQLEGGRWRGGVDFLTILLVKVFEIDRENPEFLGEL